MDPPRVRGGSTVRYDRGACCECQAAHVCLKAGRRCRLGLGIGLAVADEQAQHPLPGAGGPVILQAASSVDFCTSNLPADNSHSKF